MGLGFRVWGLGFGGLGFRVYELGCRRVDLRVNKSLRLEKT